ELFFQGHYPGHPVMPGVLVIEAMAQVGGLLLLEAVEDVENKTIYFMALDNVKWRRPITPGDQIRFELEMLQLRRYVCRMRGVGYVDGQVAVEAEMMAGIRDRGGRRQNVEHQGVPDGRCAPDRSDRPERRARCGRR